LSAVPLTWICSRNVPNDVSDWRRRASQIEPSDFRRFLGTAAITLAAAQFGMFRSAEAQSWKGSTDRCAADQAGHEHFVRLTLLRGWPYDIHSYCDLAPLLASAGYRVIVPYLRGYGTTRFLSIQTVRNGAAVGRRPRYHRVDGCAQDRQGDPGRF
jgi:pimeloyl-ACP methyl ester carboxylesterase